MAVKTITLCEIKPRLAELEEVFAAGEPDWEYPENTEFCDRWEEFAALQTLRHDLDQLWNDDSTTLIRSLDFTEHCRELLYDIGDIQKGGICDDFIDYDKVSESLEQDYRLVIYDQEDYFVRN